MSQQEIFNCNIFSRSCLLTTKWWEEKKKSRHPYLRCVFACAPIYDHICQFNDIKIYNKVQYDDFPSARLSLAETLLERVRIVARVTLITHTRSSRTVLRTLPKTIQFLNIRGHDRNYKDTATFSLNKEKRRNRIFFLFFYSIFSFEVHLPKIV